MPDKGKADKYNDSANSPSRLDAAGILSDSAEYQYGDPQMRSHKRCGMVMLQTTDTASMYCAYGSEVN